MAEKTIYKLDPEKRIISVDGPWDQFARENGGRNTSFSDIQGKSIFDFITGDITRMWFEALTQLVTLRKEPIEKPYRCDSPDLKRYMSMRIIPERSDVLRFEHDLISEEKRPVCVDIRYSYEMPCGINKIRCSICGRVKTGDLWVEPDFNHVWKRITLTVTYSVCESCSIDLPCDV